MDYGYAEKRKSKKDSKKKGEQRGYRRGGRFRTMPISEAGQKQ